MSCVARSGPPCGPRPIQKTVVDEVLKCALRCGPWQSSSVWACVQGTSPGAAIIQIGIQAWQGQPNMASFQMVWRNLMGGEGGELA